MITEKRVEEALTYLARTDDDFGTLKGLVDGIEYRIKVAEAAAYLKSEGTQDHRKSQARTDETYKQLIEEYENNKIEFLTIGANRRRQELVIEVWKTINYSKGRGNV